MALRILSSRWTFFSKYLFPGLWLSAGGSGVAGALASSTAGASGWRVLAPLGVGWLFGCVFIGRMAWYLERVSLDGATLIVSNYWRSARIPVAALRRVTVERFVRGQPIALEFAEPTAFGRRVEFLPRSGFGAATRSAAVAEELRRLAGLEPAG